MQSGNHSLLLTGPTHVQLKDVGPAVTVKVLIRVLSEAKKTAAACGMKTHDLIRPMLASGSTDRYFYVLSLEATTRVESGVLQLLGCVVEAVPETCLQQNAAAAAPRRPRPQRADNFRGLAAFVSAVAMAQVAVRGAPARLHPFAGARPTRGQPLRPPSPGRRRPLPRVHARAGRGGQQAPACAAAVHAPRRAVSGGHAAGGVRH